MTPSEQEQQWAAGELDDLMTIGSGLSAWEIDFVERRFDDVEAGKNLSSYAIGMIHKIWDRVSS